MLHGHGDNGYLYAQEIIADFSSNVWYGGEPAGLRDHLFREWKRINKYPEPLAGSLAIKAASHHALDPENILITNGATESIYMLAQAYKHKNSCILIPGFAEYEDACIMHEHRIRFLREKVLSNALRGNDLRNDLLKILNPTDDNDPDLVWICNPNNPTGDVFYDLGAVIRDHPQTLFIVDESFIDFTLSIQSLIPLVGRLRNLIVLRSLTKSFAIPGLRLGYIVADREQIKKLQAIKLPWSVNALALGAGDFIFDHYEDIQIPLKQLLADKEDFTRQLQKMSVMIHPSHTHYFLCETVNATAGELHRTLLEKFQILIRDASNFRGLSNRHFRLATLAPDQNELLITALNEWRSNASNFEECM